MATALSNAPLDPFEAFDAHVSDLFEEAKNYLDGEPIENEQQEEAVAQLLNRLRRAGNDADEARKAEKKPHDDAARAVQSKWKPLLDKCDMAVSAAKKALAPWLAKKEEAARADADAAQAEADRQAAAAREAAANAAPDDLAGQTTARILQENAAAAAKHANKLDKVRVQARGGERAVSLRTSWTAEVTDPVLFMRWAWTHRQSDVTAFLEGLAATEARSGPRDIPGLKMTQQRNAV